MIEKLLAADIGGTKASLGLFSRDSGPRLPVYTSTFSCRRFADPKALLAEFIKAAGADASDVKGAVLGVAGPVIENKSRLTNMPWLVDAAELAEALGIESVLLLNDLEAMAYSIPLLRDDEVTTLVDGEPISSAPVALVAPGTGLGEALLLREGTSYRAIAGVAGHADFAPNGAEQLALLEYLQKRRVRVSFENVCSGPGIFNIFEFLKDTAAVEEPGWLRDRLDRAEDPTPVIIEAAGDGDRPCEICARAVDIFVSILGAEAGNAALRGLAVGGVYLGGGVVPRLSKLIDRRLFADAFRNKEPMSFVLEKTPVRVIEKSDAALMGAAALGLERL